MRRLERWRAGVDIKPAIGAVARFGRQPAFPPKRSHCFTDCFNKIGWTHGSPTDVHTRDTELGCENRCTELALLTHEYVWRPHVCGVDVSQKRRGPAVHE